MTLSRVIRAVGGEGCAPMPVRWITRVFVAADVFSFLIQGSGAGLMAKGDGSMETGERIVLAGLIFQILMFATFIAVTAAFHWRFSRSSWRRSSSSNGGGAGEVVPWASLLLMLYGTSAAIMLRNIVRALEYSPAPGGPADYLMGTEWPIYVFDALLMLLTMVVFLLRHPSALAAPRGPGAVAGGSGSKEQPRGDADIPMGYQAV